MKCDSVANNNVDIAPCSGVWEHVRLEFHIECYDSTTQCTYTCIYKYVHVHEYMYMYDLIIFVISIFLELYTYNTVNIFGVWKMSEI